MNKILKILTLIVGAIILVVLLIVGIYFFIPKNSPIQNNQDCSKVAGADSKINGADVQIQCYKNLLEKTKDVSVCQNISNSYIKDRCYNDFALVTQDYSACQTYVSSNLQEQCYINIVDSKGSAGSCEELPTRDLVTVCYSSLAIKKNSSASCEILKSTQTGKYVFANVLLPDGKMTLEKVYGSEKDYCYYSFGDYGVRMLDKGKLSACENIQNTEIKNTCYVDFAQRFQDDTICNNIADSNMKEQCITIANMPPDY